MPMPQPAPAGGPPIGAPMPGAPTGQGDTFGPQAPEAAEMQGPEAPEGFNPVMESLKILGKFAILQRDQGKPELAEWMAQGMEILQGMGQEAPGMEATAAPGPEGAGPQPVGPQPQGMSVNPNTQVI